MLDTLFTHISRYKREKYLLLHKSKSYVNLYAETNAQLCVGNDDTKNEEE